MRTIVNASHPGSRGNAHGFEDGSVVRIGAALHMLVSEEFGDPKWVRMRLGHWTTRDPFGEANWTRVGTLARLGEGGREEMVSTADCSDW